VSEYVYLKRHKTYTITQSEGRNCTNTMNCAVCFEAHSRQSINQSNNSLSKTDKLLLKQYGISA